jgi:uncharacterized membrane protein
MSDRPVFIFAATYGARADAFADYESLLELHAAKLIGTYDVALITKDADGKVHVKKHEKPTQHGAWGGIAVGAAIGIIFPASVVGTAIVGGMAGGVAGHLKEGISRADAKEFGELLGRGDAALVVIGESRLEEQLARALTRAQTMLEKEIDADREELKRALEEADKQAAAETAAS